MEFISSILVLPLPFLCESFLVLSFLVEFARKSEAGEGVEGCYKLKSIAEKMLRKCIKESEGESEKKNVVVRVVQNSVDPSALTSMRRVNERMDRLFSVFESPFATDSHRVLLVFLPMSSDVVREGIILSTSVSMHTGIEGGGRTGFGALNRAWTESKTVRICRAGDHLSLRISRQILPSLSIDV